MDKVAGFAADKESLKDILIRIEKGEIQLPDFQRNWIWDDNHVASLLASISLSYPIGAVMMLQTGNLDVRFKPRLVEGVQNDKPVDPDRLVLDGQQRLTALYQSLMSGRPVITRDTRRKPTKRYYYIDIEKALDATIDREDAIKSLPVDLVVKSFHGKVDADYSSLEKQYELGMFPLGQLYDCFEWKTGFQKHWDFSKEKMLLLNEFEASVIKTFEQYLVPIILLHKENPKEAVCQVFEKVNTGGVPLTVFELLTATYAADNFDLRHDWDQRKKELHEHKVLHGVGSDEFLQAVTLLATRDRRMRAIASGSGGDKPPAISCKRRDILRLDVDEYKAFADSAIKGFFRAGQFMQTQRIFSSRDLPYKTQLTPLSAIFAVLQKKADNAGLLKQLAQWYWCGVFGEMYGSAIETRFAKDLPEVVDWFDGGPEPDTVTAANFAPSRLLALRTRNSAAYKGLYALLLRDGGLDFKTGEEINIHMYFDNAIDIHHIFPKAWCKKHGIDAKMYDCVINKTGIAARTNRIISGNAPSKYLDMLLLPENANISSGELDNILRSHVIDPATMRADNFDAFFTAREQALLDRIEQAMGKAIAREAPVEEVLPELSIYEEEEEEDETI